MERGSVMTHNQLKKAPAAQAGTHYVRPFQGVRRIDIGERGKV